MALLTISVNRTQTADSKRGAISIAVKQTGNVLASQTENFPLDTADSYISNILLSRLNEMIRELALGQIPVSFSFDVDSEQLKFRRLFDL